MKKLVSVVALLLLNIAFTSVAHAQETTASTTPSRYACTVLNVNLCPDAPNSYCPATLYKPGPVRDSEFVFNWGLVKALQNFLIKSGYLPKGSANGTYTAATKNAIITFQKDYKLKSDQSGFTGPQTRAFIKNLTCKLDDTLPDLSIDGGLGITYDTDNPLLATVTFTVKNIGNGVASSTDYSLTGAVGDEVTENSDSNCASSELATGETCTMTYDVTFAKAGARDLVARLDVSNALREVSERNNIVKKRVTGSSTPATPSTPSTPGAVSITTLTADPATVTSSASTSVITWQTANAASCLMKDAWSGSAATSGNSTVTSFATGVNLYTLECTASNGTKASKSVTVTKSVSTEPAIVVSRPFSSDVFVPGQAGVVVNYEKQNVTGNVDITLYRWLGTQDGDSYNLKSNVADATSTTVNLPANLPIGDYKIVVSLSGTSSMKGVSPIFKVQATGNSSLAVANVTEWPINSAKTITFTRTNVSGVVYVWLTTDQDVALTRLGSTTSNTIAIGADIRNDVLSEGASFKILVTTSADEANPAQGVFARSNVFTTPSNPSDQGSPASFASCPASATSLFVEATSTSAQGFTFALSNTVLTGSNNYSTSTVGKACIQLTGKGNGNYRFDTSAYTGSARIVLNGGTGYNLYVPGPTTVTMNGGSGVDTYFLTTGARAHYAISDKTTYMANQGHFDRISFARSPVGVNFNLKNMNGVKADKNGNDKVYKVYLAGGTNATLGDVSLKYVTENKLANKNSYVFPAQNIEGSIYNDVLATANDRAAISTRTPSYALDRFILAGNGAYDRFNNNQGYTEFYSTQKCTRAASGACIYSNGMRAYTTLAGAVSKFSVISVTASSPFTPISSGYVWGFLGTTSGSTKLADVAGLFSNWSGGSVSSATNY